MLNISFNAKNGHRQLLKGIIATAFLYFLLPFVYAQDPNKEADLALEPPKINTSPLPHYDYDKLDYGMTIGIERTLKGRIWACWVAGGDNHDAFFVLATSDNEGKSWSKPRMVIDGHDPSLEQKRRNVVGCLWLDPTGKLWLFFDQSMTMYDGRAGNWYTICENPDSDTPEWSDPVRLSDGMTLNKPIVLSDGTWLLNVSLWDRSRITPEYKDAFHELDEYRMANVYFSTNQGKTWSRKGGVQFPKAVFDEHHVIERKDGSLWMTARTGDGIWESISNDKGATWSTPQKFLNHTSSRHHMRRLQSGNILMVKHGDLNEKTKFRSKLTAYISDDEGKNWKGGLLLDERRGVSYPDGFQAPDGSIFISYDRNREWDGEILMARFTENDILNRKFISKKSKPKILISKPIGLDKLTPPSTMKEQ